MDAHGVEAFLMVSAQTPSKTQLLRCQTRLFPARHGCSSPLGRLLPSPQAFTRCPRSCSRCSRPGFLPPCLGLSSPRDFQGFYSLLSIVFRNPTWPYTQRRFPEQ